MTEDWNAPQQTETPAEAGLGVPGQAPVQPPNTVNEVSELVADLLEPSGLVAVDRLRTLRGRVGQGSIAQALGGEGLASGQGVARALANRHHLPYVDILATEAHRDALEAIQPAVRQRLGALPYEIEGRTLRGAIADPANVVALDELRLATGYNVELAVAAREDLIAEIQRLSRAADGLDVRVGAEIRAIQLTQAEEAVEEGDDLEVDDGVSDAPLVRLVNALIHQAAEDGASDVHVEPQDDCLLVRFRIDGVLQEVQRIPKRLSAGVTTRLKVLAKLDIAERRKPQDGRISLNAQAVGRLLDIRVATLPTVEGESVVMRLLDKSKRAPTMAELGMSEEMRDTLQDLIH